MLKKLNKEKGFTIIEVLIVLAIAGVIMLVVFLAVPALQRNSRNTQRRSDVSHLAGLINEYLANNSGSSPTAIAAGAAPTPPAANTVYLGTENFSQISSPVQTINTVPGSLPALTLDSVVVYRNATCSGNTPTGGAGSKSLVMYYALENGSGNSPTCTSV